MTTFLLELLRLSFSSVLVESYLIVCRKNRRLYIKYHPDEKVSFYCLNRDRRLICNISCNDVWDSLFLLVFFHRAHIDLFRGIDFYLPRQQFREDLHRLRGCLKFHFTLSLPRELIVGHLYRLQILLIKLNFQSYSFY